MTFNDTTMMRVPYCSRDRDIDVHCMVRFQKVEVQCHVTALEKNNLVHHGRFQILALSSEFDSSFFMRSCNAVRSSAIAL